MTEEKSIMVIKNNGKFKKKKYKNKRNYKFCYNKNNIYKKSTIYK